MPRPPYTTVLSGIQTLLYNHQFVSAVDTGGDLPQAEIGIIGGSGLYSMPGLSKTKEVRLKTPFGVPSQIAKTGASGRSAPATGGGRHHPGSRHDARHPRGSRSRSHRRSGARASGLPCGRPR